MNGFPLQKNRRRFDDAFKRRAVQTLMESGKSVTAIAAMLEVDRTNLQRWKEKYSASRPPRPPAEGETPVGAGEFLALKREFESIKEAVSQLRGVVRKSLAEKY